VGPKPGLALAGLLLVSPALAEQETGLSLSYQAPPDCPSQAAVEAQISSLLAAPVEQDAPLRSIRADALIVERNERFQLELELHDGALLDRRQFEGATCEEVAGAAAVAIALLMRPNEAASGAQPSGAAAGASTGLGGAQTQAAASTVRAPAAADAGSPEAAAGTAGEQDEQPARDDDSERAFHFLLLAPSVGVGFGLLPQPSVGLGAGLGIEPGPWRFVLSGFWHPELGFPIAEVAGGALEVRRQTVSALGCRWLLRGSFELAPCLSLSLQVLTARATGEAITSDQVGTVWLALGPTALGRVRLGKVLALTANLGVEIETARPLLIIEGLGTVEQVGPLELNLGLGLEWIF